jgi:hypothetical protein
MKSRASALFYGVVQLRTAFVVTLEGPIDPWPREAIPAEAWNDEDGLAIDIDCERDVRPTHDRPVVLVNKTDGAGGAVDLHPFPGGGRTRMGSGEQPQGSGLEIMTPDFAAMRHLAMRFRGLL